MGHHGKDMEPHGRLARGLKFRVSVATFLFKFFLYNFFLFSRVTLVAL
jgi:hypothetical protein